MRLHVFSIDNKSKAIDGDTPKGLAAITEAVAARRQARGINNNNRVLGRGRRAIGIDNDNRGVGRGRGRGRYDAP